MENFDNSGLGEFFQRYKEACPDVEPGPNFMPALWQRIEARHSFWFVFSRLGKTFMTASAAVCLLLLVLNFVTTPQTFIAPTYVDQLMADHTAEKTYYTEAIRSTPPSDEVPGTPQQ
jgi:hypothetical protein